MFFFKLTSNDVLSDIYNEHNHDKCDEQVLTRQKISNAVKRKAVDDISARPSKILHNEFKNGDISTLTTNDVTLIKQNIHYARSLLHPKLPKSIHETQNALKSMNIMTNKDENFIFLNDFENSIVGFSTKINLDVLCDVKDIYILTGRLRAVLNFLLRFLRFTVSIKIHMFLLCFCCCPQKSRIFMLKHFNILLIIVDR